MNLSVKVY